MFLSMAILPCIHFAFDKSVSQDSKSHTVMENKTYSLYDILSGYTQNENGCVPLYFNVYTVHF